MDGGGLGGDDCSGEAEVGLGGVVGEGGEREDVGSVVAGGETVIAGGV